jgi:hypothetical protein
MIVLDNGNQTRSQSINTIVGLTKAPIPIALIQLLFYLQKHFAKKIQFTVSLIISMNSWKSRRISCLHCQSIQVRSLLGLQKRAFT